VIFRNLGQRGERDCCGLSQPAHDSVSRRRGVQGTALASGSVRKRESVTQGGDRGAPEGHFFFQAEDCIRFRNVTGVQTCALPILTGSGFGPGLLLSREAFRLTRGQLRYYFTTSLARGKHKRGFCPECGSRVTGGEFEGGESPRSEERRVGKGCGAWRYGSVVGCKR